MLKRSQGGDDIPENLVGLCGDGTRGCHGAIENESLWHRRELGEYLRLYRPDTILWLRSKLGDEAAFAWLERRLFMVV